MSDLLEPKAKRETATEPPKKWRNWYYYPSRESLMCEAHGHEIVGPGLTCGCTIFPSADLAETAAQAHIEESPGVLYLGAYPEGERP